MKADKQESVPCIVPYEYKMYRIYILTELDSERRKAHDIFRIYVIVTKERVESKTRLEKNFRHSMR